MEGAKHSIAHSSLNSRKSHFLMFGSGVKSPHVILFYLLCLQQIHENFEFANSIEKK